MSISYKTERFIGLKQALEQANLLQTVVLFSEVKKIDYIDPLSFYRAGRERYEGERFFWQDPEKEIVIAGLGKALKLQVPADLNRFSSMEANWSTIRNTAVITGVTDIIATGPLLFGGFSFDPNKSDSRLWEHFGDNLFYIPSLMLSVVKGQAYVTTNTLCTPGVKGEMLIEQINDWDKLVKGKTTESMAENKVQSQTEIHPEAWKDTVAQAVQELKETDMDKIVLARELRVTCTERIQSETVLNQMQKEQPKSYIFSLESESDCFIGATPERLVKKQDSEMLSACLAGSIARGKTEEQDTLLGNELLHDEKNLMEHQYVVSMITGALETVCEKLMVPREPGLMKNRHIQHLYTPVRGTCARDVSMFQVVDKLHPTPAMGGLPKEKAVSRIREIEELERGFYAGPIGWIDSYGNGEFAVGIRSGLLQGNEASLFAGCGVVADSIPESEYRETSIKFNPMLSALGGTLNE